MAISSFVKSFSIAVRCAVFFRRPVVWVTGMLSLLSVNMSAILGGFASEVTGTVSCYDCPEAERTAKDRLRFLKVEFRLLVDSIFSLDGMTLSCFLVSE